MGRAGRGGQREIAGAREDRADRTRAPDLIAGRYAVEAPIAAGAMGEVFAVRELATGKRLALKRLLATQDSRLYAMFEREYRTLADLDHPAIIEVYDYGFEGERPHYTMELLDGQDLRQLAPLPFERVCRYLRDIASALALLHARRLVHRDLSPRNVRVTGDDRIKLLDFGAMTGFGVVDVIAGTPPFLAPESLRRAAIDQRADLFALGALAYWLLTRQHAFPARMISELPDLWRQAPPAPSRVLAKAAPDERERAPIPPALDDLIASLLSLDPLARPASAAEVVDRLTAIAGLAPAPQARHALSYLHRAPVVGREREGVRISRRLERALRGRGSCTLLAGGAGAGATRMIEDLCLRAQLAGAAAISVNAAEERGLYGAAHAIVDQLLVSMPEGCARAAGDHAPVLARFSARLSVQLAVSSSEPGALPPGELRARTQGALHAWLTALAAVRPLVIAIDDAQHLDPGSAALLAALAHSADRHPIMLLLAHKLDEPAVDTALAQLLSTGGKTVELTLLAPDDVQALVHATFGAVEHGPRLASWLHELSGGSPKICMELVRELVERNVIRFDQGAWLLPKELPEQALPKGASQILAVRLARLGSSARHLCESMSAQRSRLPIDLCLQLAHDESIADGQKALAELVEASVIAQRGSAFQFADEHLRKLAYEAMPLERRTALHRRLGALLSGRAQLDVDARLEAGFHLLRGGEERAGAELLAQAGTELTHRADELPAAAPALCAALEAFERLGYGPRKLSSLLSALALAGYRVDRRYATRYGERALATFEGLIGLSLAARLAPVLGRRLGLWLGLGSGAVRATLRYGVRGPQRFMRSIQDFVVCAVSLAGTAALCHNRALAQRSIDALEPLSLLGADHMGAHAHDFARTLGLAPLDRMIDVRTGCERILEGLGRPSASVRRVPAESLALLRGGVLYALGMSEVIRGGVAGLESAEPVEAVGLELYAMAADQLRAQYHTLRGESARVSELTARIELRALGAGSTWQVELWAPAARLHGHVLARDALGVRARVAELERLAAQEPGFRPFETFARAAYATLTGDAQRGLELFRELYALPPRSIMAWPAMLGEHACCALDLGLLDEAGEVIERAFAHSTAGDHEYAPMYARLFIARARLAAARGDAGHALCELDASIARYEPDRNPLILGDLHRACACIALSAGDMPRARRAVEAAESWFRASENPVLIAQGVQLQRSLEGGGELLDGRESSLPPTRIEGSESSTASSSTASSAGPSGEVPASVPPGARD